MYKKKPIAFLTFSFPSKRFCRFLYYTTTRWKSDLYLTLRHGEKKNWWKRLRTVSEQKKHNIYEDRTQSLVDWFWPCWKTYGGPIKRGKRRMKNSSWLRTYVVKSRSKVSVRSCKESIVCCSVTCGVEYWDCKTVITTISFPWRKHARSMISFRAARIKTLVRG